VTNSVGVLAGLAASDVAAGVESASADLFVGVMLSLAFEAEVRRLGYPVEGSGFACRPVLTEA
jgi:hypothetical protein